MYVDSSTIKRGDKSYTRYLLRKSFRENGRVKHRTIANLSALSLVEINALKLAFKHKNDLKQLGSIKTDIKIVQGKSVGALLTIIEIAKKVGITKALGNNRDGLLALWQICARIIDQGSRLSATRLARSHAVSEVMGVSFNEEHLYANLDWLCEQQQAIEDHLFKSFNQTSELFFYDVTSSYLEGECNELASFGYNRDGKKGKRQIVIGLLCNDQGIPLAIEVFPGNTPDLQTFNAQVKKVAERFGQKEVTFVGDRGMIKSKQIDELGEQGFHYISAISKPQINKLINAGVLQMSLFDNQLSEVEDNGLRYILRRNPVRQEEMANTRAEKIARVKEQIQSINEYLSEHSKAKVETAQKQIEKMTSKLRVKSLLRIEVDDRSFKLVIDEQALQNEAALDGCYVLKTDLSKTRLSKEQVNERYKDLSQVEWAFRTAKTSHLEMRPLYVRKAKRTKGHALVVMLSYRIVYELRQCWQGMDVTVEEAINRLSQICVQEVRVNGQTPFVQIPEVEGEMQEILKLAKVELPSAIATAKKGKISTKNKLKNSRK